MIEDLMADSKRWDEELRRSRSRGTRPGSHEDRAVNFRRRSNHLPVYEDTEIHERRQLTGPSHSTSAFSATQPRTRDGREDYVDEYGRPHPPLQRTVYPSSMAPDYPQSYPVTSGSFQNPPIGAQSDYILSRGLPEGYGQVPRSSEYEMYAAAGPTAGRGATLQSPNQGQFASQQGLHGSGPYQDPRTGQIIYPPAPAGRGFDHSSRHTNSADGRRR